MTAKEYAILEYLMRNKDCVVDEQILKESIFSFEENVSSNILNVYIYRLRTKLDKQHDLKLIKTYRNQGFKISEENF